MSLVLNLDPETEARLRRRSGEANEEPEALAAALLADALRADAVGDDLTDEDWRAVQEAIRQGDKDFAEGRFRRLSELVAEKHERFGV